jgi:methylenetetrahydrofolate dehydrogenase (NADP+)/methenyltetrahydrofolate cyclohydrolase
MTLFDGRTFARERERALAEQVQRLHAKKIFPKIVAVLFTEDEGSQLYTRLKKEAAERVGIVYDIEQVSILDEMEKLLATLEQLNQDRSVTGIIIQKPSKARWEEVARAHQRESDFAVWWQELVAHIDEKKDVDGLHPNTLVAVEQGSWRQDGKVMPATAKAVLEILQVANREHPLNGKIIVIGKSDILGKPLFYELRNSGADVEMIGRTELAARIASGQKMLDAQVVISATGQAGLVTGDLVAQGVIAIDVGEPKPDIDPDSVKPKAAFFSPVPGGVGPVTIVGLLENAVEFASRHSI